MDEERLARRAGQSRLVLVDLATGGPAESVKGTIAINPASFAMFVFDGEQWRVVASAQEEAGRG